MVVFQIYVADFLLFGVDTKRQAAVAGDAKAPSALAIARKRVCLPGRERAQFLRVLHVIEECQHLPKLVC